MRRAQRVKLRKQSLARTRLGRMETAALDCVHRPPELLLRNRRACASPDTLVSSSANLPWGDVMRRSSGGGLAPAVSMWSAA